VQNLLIILPMTTLKNYFFIKFILLFNLVAHFPTMPRRTRIVLVVLAVFTSLSFYSRAQPPGNITVTGYFFGKAADTDSIAVDKLTHIIFSFCHLSGNVLKVDNADDATTITALVGLKKKNPSLKVLLSLGGWGGCATCSDVFSTARGRKDFAASVLQLNQFFKTDGIDIDWEYPVVEGFPGHKFGPADKQNFTDLILELRSTLGNKFEVTFAAGGFQKFLENAVDWKAVAPVVDRINLMTYDLVNGNSTSTGHHTPLYSNASQHESTDNAVKYLIKAGVPANKLVLGAATYGRMWEGVSATQNGLYQSGKFKQGLDYKKFDRELTAEQGWKNYWDDVAKAPYAYNAGKQLFITYDDTRSMTLKTQYAIDQKLNGIMYWEIMNDKYVGGLLEAIDRARKSHHSKP
jgi:chitinase